MPSLIDYIHWLQDAEYNRSAKAIMNGIAQLTKGQGSKLQQSLVALELKAKSLESAKFYSSEVYSTVLADFRADMNAIERALIANADDIAQSGGEVARRSTLAKMFPGTTQDLIEQGINPLDAEVFAYFMEQISDKNLKIVVPPASELVGSYTQSQEFIDYMSKWGSGYADYMDDAVRQGLASGWSPIKTAYYVRDMATNLPMNAASTWTRTLQLNAYRDASARMERENGEFVEKKIRIAALDARTCPACIALHGTEVPMGIRIDDHYLGRCDAIYIPAGGEMPEFMQVMSTPGERQFVPFQKGTDWFDAQPDAYKQSVLGKGKFELYKQGKFKLEDIVSWRNDPIFGMMPGVKPLWELEGYKSYKDKLAALNVARSATVMDDATWMQFMSVRTDLAELDALYKDWTLGLSYEDKSAIQSYTGTSYMSLNKTLREQKSLELYQAEQSQRISGAIANAPATVDDMVVYRGIDLSPDDVGMLEGNLWRDLGFMSTSLSEKEAEGGFSHHYGGSLFQIIVPKGSTGCAYIQRLSNVGREQEFLFDKGSSFYVRRIYRRGGLNIVELIYDGG